MGSPRAARARSTAGRPRWLPASFTLTNARVLHLPAGAPASGRSSRPLRNTWGRLPNAPGFLVGRGSKSLQGPVGGDHGPLRRHHALLSPSLSAPPYLSCRLRSGSSRLRGAAAARHQEHGEPLLICHCWRVPKRRVRRRRRRLGAACQWVWPGAQVRSSRPECGSGSGGGFPTLAALSFRACATTAPNLRRESCSRGWRRRRGRTHRPKQLAAVAAAPQPHGPVWRCARGMFAC